MPKATSSRKAWLEDNEPTPDTGLVDEAQGNGNDDGSASRD
jgi:hypothetical protein